MALLTVFGPCSGGPPSAGPPRLMRRRGAGTALAVDGGPAFFLFLLIFGLPVV